MKIVIVNDQHFGCRNDSIAFMHYMEKFYSNILNPYIIKNNIATVFDLGDTFDRRKYINFYTLDFAKKTWFDFLAKNNVDLHVLVGNHTTFFKNTNELNAIDSLLREYANVRVYKSPCDVNIGELDICVLPWINSENHNQTVEHIKDTKAEVAFGHLEISGFEMDRGNICHDGLDRKLFHKFDMVLSGHFHHKSSDGQIFYLGNQYQITWSDYGDKRGFHVFDTTTRELEFVENPYKMFHKITYDDKNDITFENLKDIDFAEYTASYVKVLVLHKTNPYLFDRYIQKLTDAAPLDVSIIEDISDLTSDENDAIIDEAENTITILDKYVDGLKLDLDQIKLKNILHELYVEAVNLEKV